MIWTYHNCKTSRVTRISLVLWIGNETLRVSRFGNASCVTDVWSLYRITAIHWLMARRRPWRHHVVSSYWRTRHPLLRFLCRKELCRQREELGSKRSVSFPIQRTRVTRVTRDVLYHRFTQHCVLHKQAKWRLSPSEKSCFDVASPRRPAPKQTNNWGDFLQTLERSTYSFNALTGQSMWSLSSSLEAKGGGWKEWSVTTWDRNDVDKTLGM